MKYECNAYINIKLIFPRHYKNSWLKSDIELLECSKTGFKNDVRPP